MVKMDKEFKVVMENNVFARIRQSTGLTQKEFAHVIGVSSVGCWEQGRHFPNHSSMKKLVEFCARRNIGDIDEVKSEWSTWRTKKRRKSVRRKRSESLDNPFTRIRQATGLTQKEFAQIIGVRSVANWERGRCYPNYGAMKKIVQFCEENHIDYSEAQEAWKRRNRTTSRNKCAAQQIRWEKFKARNGEQHNMAAQIRNFIRQCDGNSESQLNMRRTAQQMLEMLRQKTIS